MATLKPEPKQATRFIGYREREDVAAKFEKLCVQAGLTLSQGLRQLVADHVKRNGK